VERHSGQLRAAGVFEQPSERELIRSCEDDHGLVTVARARSSVFERCVNGLASLVTSGQISPGDDIQAVLVHAAHHSAPTRW
jgi:hypothetical protein